MAKLTNKVAVVTGASKGIGAGIAKTLAEAGATVVVNFSTDQNGADAVVSNIVAKGGKAIAVQGSVANAAEVQHLFAVTKKEFGKLDILVNKAYGVDLQARNGDDSFVVPFPASYLVDSKGMIRYAFLDPDYTHRLEPSTALGWIDEMLQP